MARIGIVQISDTQFGPKHVFKSDEGSSTLSRQLVLDVLAVASKHAFVPTYLVCSGDIAELGTTDQFEVGIEVFRQICDGISIDTNNALFCPGNHDINWTLSRVAEEVGDPRLRLSCYDKFCERFFGGRRNHDESQFQIVNDYRFGVCFVLIDSCEKEDHEKHIGHVSTEKLLNTLQTPEFKHACTQGFLNVAILHHRIDVAAHEERSAIDNAPEVVAILLAHFFQVVLTGHVHAEFTHATKMEGRTIVYSGCGSTGVDKSQRDDGVPNQYSIHVLDDQHPTPTIESYFRAFNPSRKTRLGIGGWTDDSTYDNLPLVHSVKWDPQKQLIINEIIEDPKLSGVLRIRKNPFTVSNAEKFTDELVLKLFVHDEERHRAALRLSGDAIIRGKRGSGKTMCLKYLNAIATNKFRTAVKERKRAECFPVLVNLGQLHVSETDGDLDSIYHAAENLIVEQTLDAFELAQLDVQSAEFRSSLHRAKQRHNMLTGREGSAIAHLGSAISEHLHPYFDHVLLLIDEIAPVFPKVFFREPEKGFGKWMNAIRNSGPYNTRITVYPNDVSDTLNEERFGTVVNLEYEPTKSADLQAFRKYSSDLFERYMLSVATDPSNSPKIADLLVAQENDSNDALEQLLYATDGSSRRLMRFFEKSLTVRCTENRSGALSKELVWQLIGDYSATLLRGYSQTEQRLALSIAKACKSAATFRFRCPGLSEGIKRLCLGREETNVVSIVEVGSGTRATSYEFHFPYCVQMNIPTHHIKDTNRICKGRDIGEGEWIQKITNLKRENLDIFEDEERVTGKVVDFIDGAVVIEVTNGQQFLAEDPQLELQQGDTVSFIAIDGSADDLLLV